MQKMLFARETAGASGLLIVEQPTQGLDVGAIEFVRKTLLEKRSEGIAILLISADLDEVLELSDRIMVMEKWYTSAARPKWTGKPSDWLWPA